MPRDRSPHRPAAIPLTILLLVTAGTSAAAQALDDRLSSAAIAAASQSPTTEPTNPWSTRPVCASMFLKSDWQLTPKQRACDWLQNGVLSTGRLFTTAFATGFAMAIDSSEPGDSFKVRFGRNWVRGAFATTGEYVGGLIADEDARQAPPYLAMRTAPPPHGFFKRFGTAIGRNVVTSQCVNRCRDERDIHKRFGFSRVLGAVASGAGGVAVDWDSPDRGERAWHGMVAAYAGSFGHALVTEFKPELTAFGGRLFRLLGVH